MAKHVPIEIDESVKARFWVKVDVRGPDECWPWRERLNRKGYGSFAVRGRRIASVGTKRRQRICITEPMGSANRASYARQSGGTTGARN